MDEAKITLNQENTGQKTQHRVTGLVVALTLFVLYIGVSIYNYKRDEARFENIIQNVLDENIQSNRLLVTYVSIPFSESLQYSQILSSFSILPPRYDGFFTFAYKDRSALQKSCGGPVDFTVTKLGGTRIQVQLSGEGFAEAQNCN